MKTASDADVFGYFYAIFLVVEGGRRVVKLIELTFAMRQTP